MATKRIHSTEQDSPLRSHYKVRIVIAGAILHVASWTEPTVDVTGTGGVRVTADWIRDHRYGDTIGHISWDDVRHVSWRFHPEP